MKTVYLVPNIVTSANLFCGFYSIISSMKGDYFVAAWAVFAAAIFDLLDGRIARLAKATSDFGVEYDSLCDLVSFGLAPAVLLFLWQLQPLGRLGWILAFLFVLCGALRLARFNVSVETTPKGDFQGLPIPIAANFITMFWIFQDATDILNAQFVRTFSIVAIVGIACLMVSNVRFPSFKEFNWRSRGSFGYLMVGILSLVLIAWRPEIALFLVVVAYVILGLFKNILEFFRGAEVKEAKNVR